MVSKKHYRFVLLLIYPYCATLGRLGHNHDDPDRADNPVDWKLSFAAKPKKNIVSDLSWHLLNPEVPNKIFLSLFPHTISSVHAFTHHQPVLYD